MGRIFEVRKATMFARWDRMAKQFTRVGKEIIIAVKPAAPTPPPTLPCVGVFKMHEVWECQKTE